MPHLVVGTAGHIDHGKSALVFALTGTDPDRLKEEKRRGITIELGFADLDLGDGSVLSFVDVPGHERFVRHMVAGAAGIDAVLLVVAADQGVQPQTREHLEICSLLSVGRGIVALTKCDLVEPELAEVAALEVRELLAGTFLESAPLIPVSAKSGEGLADLRGELGRLLEQLPRRPIDGVARLSVDRAFVQRGFGTVVTGTLVSGCLREGEEIEVLPGNLRGRIRGLQVHRRKVAEAAAGRRTAVNLQGLDVADVPRGATITAPGALPTTRRLWARLSLLESAPEAILRGGPVRFHQATAETAARLRVLGRGDDGTLQAELHLRRDTVVCPGDRFILRRPAPVDTVGGGVVVDVRPPSARERIPEAFAVASLDLHEALALRMRRAGVLGRETSDLCLDLGSPRAVVEPVLERETQSFIRAGSRWFDRSHWEQLERNAVQRLSAFHSAEPLRPGLSREALRSLVAREMSQDAWRELLAGLASKREVTLNGEVAALIEHRVVLSEEELEVAAAIEGSFREAGLEPPDLKTVLPAGRRESADPIVQWLLAQGKLVRIQDRRLFHAEALEALREKLRLHARDSRTIDVATFKQLAGVTRKNAIPLLEQLDHERSTRRVGNAREILLSAPD